MSIYKTKQMIIGMMTKDEFGIVPEWGTILYWFRNLNPYLTLRECYEITRKFINVTRDGHGETIIDYFKNIPADEYYTELSKKELDNPLNYETHPPEIIMKNLEKVEGVDYTELKHLYNLLNNNPEKLKVFLKSDEITDYPYVCIFKYLLEHKNHNHSQTNDKPSKKIKQKKQEDSDSEYEPNEVKKITDSVLKDKLLKIKNETKEIKDFLKK